MISRYSSIFHHNILYFCNQSLGLTAQNIDTVGLILHDREELNSPVNPPDYAITLEGSNCKLENLSYVDCFSHSIELYLING